MSISRSQPNLSLGIIFPVFNEGNGIAEFLDQLDKTLQILPKDITVTCLAVNNGSVDNTLDELMRSRMTNADLVIVTLTRNFGYEVAFEVGLREFDFDLYCLLDSDGEDPVDLIPKFYNGIVNGYDIAYGLRLNRNESKVNQILRNVFYKVLSKIADDPFRINVGEFSMMTKRVRDSLVIESNSYPFWRASISRTGLRSLEFGHNRKKRISGVSHHNKKAMFKFAVIGILSTTTWPLRFTVYSNLFILNLSFFVLIHQLIQPLNPKMLLVLFTSIVATWGFSLSSIAMYVARIYKNGLKKPNYYIQDIRKV